MSQNPTVQAQATETSGNDAVAPLGKPRHEVTSAPQWKLIWWRFRRHRLAMIGLVIMIALYIGAAFAGFLAPYNTSSYSGEHAYQPPQVPHLSISEGFYIHPTTGATDPETLAPVFTEDTTRTVPLRFLVKGDEYKLFGLIPSDRHLFGPSDPSERWYLLGADRSGGDLFSKILYGSQISLSIPTLPLWLGLAAAVPPQWGPVPTYFMITVILSLLGWTNLARVVRGRLLQTRGEDYVLAAKLDGVPTSRIIFRHMLPSFTSHIIATVSLAVPAMILSETSLSFLGLGLRAPAVSWGVLLQDAQSVNVIATAPWLLLPGVSVVLAVVAFNFVGDGLRDSADPYGKRST
jgi:peptide/nickel transport system permease protein